MFCRLLIFIFALKENHMKTKNSIEDYSFLTPCPFLWAPALFMTHTVHTTLVGGEDFSRLKFLQFYTFCHRGAKKMLLF